MRRHLPLPVRAVALSTLVALLGGCALLQPATPARMLERGLAVLDAVGVTQQAVIHAHAADLMSDATAEAAMLALARALDESGRLVELAREADALTGAARASKLEDAVAVVRLLVEVLGDLVVDDDAASAEAVERALLLADSLVPLLEGER